MGTTMPHNRWAEAEGRREREAEAIEDATAAVKQLNAYLKVRKAVWTWPIIGAALLAKHHWLVCTCDACTTVIELDLRMKPRDPEASIRTVLKDVRCPRCNGHGRRRILPFRF